LEVRSEVVDLAIFDGMEGEAEMVAAWERKRERERERERKRHFDLAGFHRHHPHYDFRLAFELEFGYS